MAVLSSIAMLAAVIYIPDLAQLFKTSPLSGRDWLVVLFASGFVQLGAALRSVFVRPNGHTRRMKAFH
jgi:hypothetical protein